MLIVDAHLDMAYNALAKGRDLRQSVADIRAGEANPASTATVALPEMQQAGVGICFATIFVTPVTSPWPLEPGESAYETAEQAHKMGLAQLDYYHRLADESDSIRLVGDRVALDEIVASHEPGGNPHLGIVPLMEGADPIREPQEAELWYERGVRLIGPAWDDTRYCGGAWRNGREGLTSLGYELLDVMAGLGLILDLTHMNDRAITESLDRYEGPIVATHANCRAIVDTPRQLSDSHIRAIGERHGVIGVVLFNEFLVPGYRKGKDRDRVNIDHIVAHIDHICQLLGDARHVGIGSDFDGGFGREDIPTPMDSIADLDLIGDALREKGYEAEDVAAVMGLNWVNVLRSTLPE